MVFAVHISRNRTADRYVAGAGCDGQEKAGWHDCPQNLIEAHTGPGGHGATGWIEINTIKGRHLNHRAPIKLGRIAIGTA